MKKKITALLLVMVLGCSSLVFAADTHRTIDVDANLMTVYVNGQKVEADNFVYNGTTYLPIRAVSEALGNDVDYDPNTQSAIISSGDLPKIIQTADLYSILNTYSTQLTEVIGVYEGIGSYVFNQVYSLSEATQKLDAYQNEIDQLYVSYIRLNQIILSWIEKDSFYAESLKEAKSALSDFYDSYSSLCDYNYTLYSLAAKPTDQATYDEAHTYLKTAMTKYNSYTTITSDNYTKYMSEAKEKLGVEALSIDELLPIPEDIQADLDEIMNNQQNNNSNNTSNPSSDANKQAQIDAIKAEYDTRISALKSERDRLYNNIIAEYAASTGGQVSSWAKTAAEQGVAQYDAQIAALENERDAKIAALQ